MGKRSPTDTDVRRAGATASFTAADQVTDWVEVAGRFWISAQPAGGGAGAVALEFSFDGGTTAENATLPGGGANSWTVPVLLAPVAPEEPEEPGVLARLRCSAWTSGTINARVSQ
jgi:hypothetical protein